MKAWKRGLSRVMSLVMLLGTLGSSGFTVMAAGDDGPLQLKDGEELVAEETTEEPEAPAEESDGKDESGTTQAAEEGEEAGAAEEDETAQTPAEGEEADTPAEESVSEDDADTEESVSDDAAAEEDTAEETEEGSEETGEADTEEEIAETEDDADGEPEWEWDEDVDRDERDRATQIKKIIVKLKVNGQEYVLDDSEIEQVELVRPMSCVFPAIYKYKATKIIDGTEYTDEREMGFGEVPTGHKLDDIWVLNTDDAANPYYYPDQDKTYHCSVCDQDVRFDIPWGVQRIGGDDRPSCNHDISFRLGFQYILLDENGEWTDLFPFYVESPELVIPATGVHQYMRNNDAPWWDWQYDEGSSQWHVQAVFRCGECDRDIWIEEGDELKLSSAEADGITTYTATFKSDKFYNSENGKLDRSVTYSTEKKVTENNFEVSGVEDKFYTGKAIKFDNLWVSLGDYNLQEGTDYTIKYANNTKVGKASLTITGKGKFKGSVTVNFNILPIDLNTDSFNVHDLYLVATGGIQKKASVLYWNGAAMAKNLYDVVFEDTSAGAYKEPGRYSVTIRPKKNNKNFTGSRSYYIHIMPRDLYDASKVKVTINKAYFKATPWGDIDWEVFDGPESRDENGNRKAYTVTYQNQDITYAFQECWLDVDSNTGKGVLTVTTNPMIDIVLKDKKGNDTHVQFGGTKSINITLTRGDISKLKIESPASIPYYGYAVSAWELRDFHGFKITDPSRMVDDGNGGLVPYELNMGNEYELTLKGNNKAGKMTLTITGKQGYTGKVTKTVNIEKVDLNKLFDNGLNSFGDDGRPDKAGILIAGNWWWDEDTQKDYFTMPEEVDFSKGGAIMYDLTIGYTYERSWFDGAGNVIKDVEWRGLDPKTEYTIKYTNNQKASKLDNEGHFTGEKAKITITGKGNCTGSVSFEFYIAERHMWGTYVELQSVNYKKSATMAPFLPKPKVTDYDTGKVLQLNKDYTIKYYRTIDKNKNELPEDQWIEITAKTKWDDIFADDASELTLGGHGLVCRIEGKAGSGYYGTRDQWYCIVKSGLKANEFKAKDQVLPMDNWCNTEPGFFFMPDDDGSELYKECFKPEEHYYDLNWYLNDCTDAQYTAWRDKYFSKYPTDCRFAPVMDSLKNWDKPGMASVNVEALNSWDEDNNNNPGCRGGFATVKFKIVTKSVITD